MNVAALTRVNRIDTQRLRKHKFTELHRKLARITIVVYASEGTDGEIFCRNIQS